jgi:hypothetical protein
VQNPARLKALVLADTAVAHLPLLRRQCMAHASSGRLKPACPTGNRGP